MDKQAYKESQAQRLVFGQPGSQTENESLSRRRRTICIERNRIGQEAFWRGPYRGSVPMANLLSRLILHVADFVRDAGGDLPKTKLVKLLYLIDVEYYRHFRSTLAGASWFFYLYGPYAVEIESAIRDLAGYELEETEFFSMGGKKGFAYKTFREDDLRDLLPLEQRQVVYNTLRRWAVEDLNTILDYVYFETEPMKGVRFRENLDFPKIIPAPREDLRVAAPLQIPAERLQKLKRRYREASTARRELAAKAEVVRPIFDEVYARVLRAIREEERTRMEDLRGKTIQFTEATKQVLSDQS